MLLHSRSARTAVDSPIVRHRRKLLRTFEVAVVSHSLAYLLIGLRAFAVGPQLPVPLCLFLTVPSLYAMLQFVPHLRDALRHASVPRG